MKFPEKYLLLKGKDGGLFEIKYGGRRLCVVASSGAAWEHVSVSLRNRTPNWQEMCFVKDLFWDEEECVIQYHLPKSQYVNNHDYCLHLWRPLNFDIPTPPTILTGIM